MSTNKTALEMLIEEYESIGLHHPFYGLRDELVRLAKLKLSTERRHIEDSYNSGEIDGLRYCQDRTPLYKDKSDYFTKTFKNSQNEI